MPAEYTGPTVATMVRTHTLAAEIIARHNDPCSVLDNSELRLLRRFVADPSTKDEILHDRGIMVLPDILANGGGVTVSYFEWVQDLQNNFWEEDDVNERLKRKMVRAFAETLEQAKRYRVNMRRGAYAVAIGRVAEATTMRGLYP